MVPDGFSSFFPENWWTPVFLADKSSHTHNWKASLEAKVDFLAWKKHTLLN